MYQYKSLIKKRSLSAEVEDKKSEMLLEETN